MKARKTTESKLRAGASSSEAPAIPEAQFDEIVHLIGAARQRVYQMANSMLIELYWQVGEHISRRIVDDGWGKGTVISLASYIARRYPSLRGFSEKNLWRMRQFFEAYCGSPKLSTLLRELSWSSNLHILTKTKRPEEREFYLKMATHNRWSVREVARQIDGALFERAVLNPPKLSTVLRELYPAAGEIFRDAYLVEFLGLPEFYTEIDFHRNLIQNLGRFITELGNDFCYIGSEYPLQVGGKDFAIDLLFFHRGLNCLVAIELKIGEFKPEYLGKLEFYLEALDRDVRKPHERPSIGVLLCATKDSEVVEYALSRSLSPALIAEYRTQLPDKRLLQAKLHELYELNAPEATVAETPPSRSRRKPKGAH